MPSIPPRYHPLLDERRAATNPPVNTDTPWMEWTYTGSASALSPVTDRSRETIRVAAASTARGQASPASRGRTDLPPDLTESMESPPHGISFGGPWTRLLHVYGRRRKNSTSRRGLIWRGPLFFLRHRKRAGRPI